MKNRSEMEKLYSQLSYELYSVLMYNIRFVHLSFDRDKQIIHFNINKYDNDKKDWTIFLFNVDIIENKNSYRSINIYENEKCIKTEKFFNIRVITNNGKILNEYNLSENKKFLAKEIIDLIENEIYIIIKK